MRLTRLLPPGLVAIAMSVAVTAGSMYVTVSAAANNNAAELTEGRTAIPTSLTASASGMTSVTVELTADGSLNGRFSSVATESGELYPAESVHVALMSASRESMDTTTRNDGTFSFRNVSPGVYAVHADSPEGRLAYAIRVIRSTESASHEATDLQPVVLALDIQMDFGLAPSRDNDALNNVIRSVKPDAAPLESTIETAGTTEFTRTNYEVNLAENSIGHEQLRLNEDRSLDGHVTLLNPTTGSIAAINDLTASFIKDNKLVASTTVNVDGSFNQKDLDPGIYTLVVAGTDGISYLGIDVVGNADGDYIPTAAGMQPGAEVGVFQGDGTGGTGNDDDDDGGFFLLDDGGGAVGAAAGGGDDGLLLPLLLIGGGAAALLASDDNAAKPATAKK